ncbi:MAG: choice-of-anchor D domain-containing protein [Deltaproteobacteria bacterium]|nr:choice-of-anchor D domain-containing protein [Deltaproteobacteria bacterium]
MKKRNLGFALLLPVLALLPACGGGGDGLTRAVVTVRAGVGATITGVRQLRVDVSSSGGAVTLNVPETPRDITLPTTFSVNFPKDRGGTATFMVSALDASDAVLATSTGMVTLVPGESVNLEIFLGGSPPMDGGVDAAIDDGGTVTDGAPADAPAEAALSLAPTSQNYGNVVTGNTATQIFTVMNVGGTSSGMPSVAVAGDTSFTIDTNTCTAALAPGVSCMIGVKFQPATAGAKTGSLTVNATPGGSVVAMLMGTGLPPSALTFTPSSLSFGNQLISTPSGAMTLTVRNTGGAASGAITLSLSGTSASDFAISAQTCNGMTLAPSATCTATIVFQPGTRGAKTATLNLTATPGGPTAASLMGTGQSPALLSISPTSHTFLDQNTGTTSAARSFTVSNSGDVTSSTPTVSLGGTNANQFAISSNGCSAGVALGAPCTINVTFTPTTTGAKSATLNVVAATGGSRSATLAGSGVVPGATPILRWTWDNTAANSGSSAGYTATLNGTTSYITGKVGQAIQFGGGGYATVTGTRTIMSSYPAYTIAFWVYLSGSLASQATFYNINRSTAPYGGVSVGHTGTSASLCAASTTNSLLTGSCPTFSASLNTWHHYLVRYAGLGSGVGQGAPVEMYLDNVLMATATQDAANNPVFTAGVTDTISLGAPSFVAMDDLKIYNQVFTVANQCTQVIGGTWTGTSCTLP